MTQFSTASGGGFYAHLTITQPNGDVQHVFDRVVTFITKFENDQAQASRRYGTDAEGKFYEDDDNFKSYIHETELNNLLAEKRKNNSSAPTGAQPPSKLITNVVPPKIVKPNAKKVEVYGKSRG